MLVITENFKPTTLLICLLGSSLMLSAFNAHANSPVKSIDAEGNVTYSDKPVAGAEKVTKVSIESGPTESEIEASRQQAQKNIQAAEQIDAENEIKKQQQAAKRKTSQKNTSAPPPEIIINAPPNRPLYGVKPRPPIHKPPSGQLPERPGINPPAIPTHPIARPRR